MDEKINTEIIFVIDGMIMNREREIAELKYKREAIIKMQNKDNK
jgi:hypothetical protein